MPSSAGPNCQELTLGNWPPLSLPNGWSKWLESCGYTWLSLGHCGPSLPSAHPHNGLPGPSTCQGTSCGQRLEQVPHLPGLGQAGTAVLGEAAPWWLTKVSQGTGCEKSPSWLVEAGTAGEGTGWGLAGLGCPQLSVTVTVSNWALGVQSSASCIYPQSFMGPHTL